MDDARHPNPGWRKSTKSGPTDNECVEVCFVPDAVLVRDSKDAEGAVLRFDNDAWTAFIEAVRTGGIDR